MPLPSSLVPLSFSFSSHDWTVCGHGQYSLPPWFSFGYKQYIVVPFNLNLSLKRLGKFVWFMSLFGHLDYQGKTTCVERLSDNGCLWGDNMKSCNGRNFLIIVLFNILWSEFSLLIELGWITESLLMWPWNQVQTQVLARKTTDLKTVESGLHYIVWMSCMMTTSGDTERVWICEKN